MFGFGGQGCVGERAVQLRGVGERLASLPQQIVREARAREVASGLRLALGLDPQRRRREDSAVSLGERPTRDYQLRGVREPKEIFALAASITS